MRLSGCFLIGFFGREFSRFGIHLQSLMSSAIRYQRQLFDIRDFFWHLFAHMAF